MKPILSNFLLLICFGCLLLAQSGQTARIKRSNTLTNVTTNNNTELPLVSSGLKPVAVADATKTEAKIVSSTEAAAAPAAAVAVAKTSNAAAGFAKKNQELFEDFPGSDFLSGRMQRPKRRHHNAAPPYVYFNKLVSPDGKQELKEFQLLAPNVLIESMQHDVNLGGGAAPGPVAGDVSGMGGVLLLNADNSNPVGHIHGMAKPNKHHHKHKSSALSLPPFLFMLQQMLQPNMNMNMEMIEPPMPRTRIDAPLIQFLDSAMDNAMRSNNHEIYDRERDNEPNDKDKDKEELLPEHKPEAEPKKKEQMPNRKDDELVLSCPIHHEHHASNNGEIVDDDVVLVNECHII